MLPRILVAAPSSPGRPLAAAQPERFHATWCSDPARARALLCIGGFQLILTVGGFLDDLVHPAKVVVPAEALHDPTAIERYADAAIAQRRSLDSRRGAELASIAIVPYGEYIELARYRVTRDYLLGLVELHHGNITDAARAAGLARESLHRLLRRHDVAAEHFRDLSTDAEPAVAATKPAGAAN